MTEQEAIEKFLSMKDKTISEALGANINTVKSWKRRVRVGGIEKIKLDGILSRLGFKIECNYEWED